MSIKNDFNIEEIVYLKHDSDQQPRMIISIVIDKHCVMYELACKNEVSRHYGFEFSKEKTFF